MRQSVIIVGAGPSGSLAGINLAAAGIRPLILDRARFPRVKPCGGGISYRVYERFGYIADVLRSVPTNIVSRVVLESPSGHRIESTSAEPLYAMVRRYEFDAVLLAEAARRGCDVRQGLGATSVQVLPDGVRVATTDGTVIEADLVIGADGVNSTVAVQAGLRRNWSDSAVAIDTTEETRVDALSSARDTMYVYYGFANSYGYAYIFPKPAHINIGIGYLLSYYKSEVVGTPYERHQQLIKHLVAEGIVKGQSQRSNFRAYLIPVGGPLEKLSCSRVLLTGDAGGFVNGFTAEGIYYAMVSGELAAKAAAKAVAANDFSAATLCEYDRLCAAELGSELTKSVVLQKKILSRPKRIDQVVKLASRNPEVKRLLTAFAVGKISYSQLKRAVIPRALPWYVSYKASKLWQKLLNKI